MKWGGTPDALRRAAAKFHRDFGYTWRDYGDGAIEVRLTLNCTAYICSRQARTPDRAWTVFVGDEAFRVLFAPRHYVQPRPLRSTAPVERLPWHILPPGEHPFPAILEHLRALAQRNPTVEYDHTRLEKLNSLGPTSIYIGVEEFDGYFVFCFPQYSAAVLDCPRVGNAIYLMRESDWKTLCRLTKAELLARHHAGVRRIVHSHRWFERLKACL